VRAQRAPGPHPPRDHSPRLDTTQWQRTPILKPDSESGPMTPGRRRSGWMPIIHAPTGASASAPTERKLPGRPAGRKLELERPSPLALDDGLGCKFGDSNREGRCMFCLCGSPLGTTVQSAGQLPVRPGPITAWPPHWQAGGHGPGADLLPYRPGCPLAARLKLTLRSRPGQDPTHLLVAASRCPGLCRHLKYIQSCH
jgi:hypothetical protein